MPTAGYSGKTLAQKLGVKPGDLATLATACGVLLAVSAAAAWIPARRAARIQPTQSLRYE